MQTLLSLLVLVGAIIVVPVMVWGLFLGPLFFMERLGSAFRGNQEATDGESKNDGAMFVWFLGSVLLFFSIGCWVKEHGNRPSYDNDPLADPDLYPDGPSQLPHHLR